MPQAQISIDVSGRKDLVDALDWETIFSETLTTLKKLSKAVAVARNIKRPRSARWKIADASTHSPLHLTLSEESTDLDDSSPEAVRLYLQGVRVLEAEKPPTEPPPFFDEVSLASLGRLVSVLRRDTRSLIFSSPGIDPVAATMRTAINIDELIGAKFKASGALEGDPLTDYRIACYISPDKLEEAKAAFPHRIAAYGQIRYAKSGKPLSIDIQQIRRLRLRSDLPQVEDIGKLDLTGGTDSSEYIRRLRDVE